MATLTLHPTADGTYHDMFGDDGYAAQSDGSNTTKMNSNGSLNFETYVLGNHTTESGTINSVKVVTRLDSDMGGANFYQPRLRLGTTNADGTYTQFSTQAWTNVETTIARPGGGSWSWDDIDALEAGVGMAAPGAGNLYCSEVWVVVDYTVAAAPAAAFPKLENKLMGLGAM